MSKSTFNQGDTVTHKSTEAFEMVIIGNCGYEHPDSQQLVSNSKDSSRYLCRYYNSDNKKWESECFYDFELESSEEGEDF